MCYNMDKKDYKCSSIIMINKKSTESTSFVDFADLQHIAEKFKFTPQRRFERRIQPHCQLNAQFWSRFS